MQQLRMHVSKCSNSHGVAEEAVRSLPCCCEAAESCRMLRLMRQFLDFNFMMAVSLRGAGLTAAAAPLIGLKG